LEPYSIVIHAMDRVENIERHHNSQNEGWVESPEAGPLCYSEDRRICTTVVGIEASLLFSRSEYLLEPGG